MNGAFPSIRVAAFALRRKIGRRLGLYRDVHNSPPEIVLSPSARHFSDYDRAPLALRFASRARPDAAAWQTEARAKLQSLTGYERGTDRVGLLRSDEFPLQDGLVRRRIYLQPRTGVTIPVHLIGPKHASGERPAMLCLQGTNSGAHLSWGEARFPADVGEKMQGYDIAVQAARRGYLAVAIEQSCFGEREERQIVPRSAAPCVDATMHALLLGRSLLGERCSDVSAVVDWLTDNAAGLAIDAGRIHVMGHSSGGSVAMFSAALDERIGAVLACGCVGYFRETVGRRRDDQGQIVIAGILNWLEMADVVGLIAPRPFATVAGEADHIWPAAGAGAVIEEARRIYAAFGAGGLVQHRSAPGGHRFRPELSWESFQGVLGAAGKGS